MDKHEREIPESGVAEEIRETLDGMLGRIVIVRHKHGHCVGPLAMGLKDYHVERGDFCVHFVASDVSRSIKDDGVIRLGGGGG